MSLPDVAVKLNTTFVNDANVVESVPDVADCVPILIVMVDVAVALLAQSSMVYLLPETIVPNADGGRYMKFAVVSPAAEEVIFMDAEPVRSSTVERTAE